MVTNDVVEGLAVKIKGKSDKKWKTLMIWADQHPQLCPIRHLLVYIFVAKIKSGNLFPSYNELRHPPDDGDFKT